MGSSLPGSGQPEQTWKIGALARATGLTVRALHHYDHIGLLTPSGRTDAGHRVYSAGDVARLYRISLLRRLGFPLGQIAAVLDDPQWQLPAAVQRHWATPGAGPPQRRAWGLAWPSWLPNSIGVTTPRRRSCWRHWRR